MAIVIPDGKQPEDIFVIQNENYLINNIEARHYTSYLFVNGVFSEDEMDSVDDTVEFQERNKLLLKLLTDKGKDGFKVFKKVLHKRGYLNMDLIEHKMKVRKESTMGPKHIIIDRAWREFIDPKDEIKILQNRAVLIRKMEACRLTSYLATKQVIDGYDMAAVDTLPGALANKELLRVVCSRGSTAFMWFVEGLRVNGFGRLSTLLFGRPITSSTKHAESDDSDDSSSTSSSSFSSASDDDHKEDRSDVEKSQKTDNEAQVNMTQDSPSQMVDDSTTHQHNGDVQLDTITEEPEQPTNEETQSDKANDTQSNENDVDSQTPKDRKTDNTNDDNDTVEEGTSKTQIKTKDDDTHETLLRDGDESHPQPTDAAVKSNTEQGNDTQKVSENKSDDKGTNDATEPSERPHSKSNETIKPLSRQSQRSGRSSRKKRSRTSGSPFKKTISRNIVREPIDYVEAEKLKCHLGELERSLDAESVAANLMESNIIDRIDVENIAALREPHQKVRELVSLVFWGGHDGFRLFLTALLETNQTFLHHILTAEKRNSVKMNESAIPCIVIDEVGQSEDAEDEGGNKQSQPTKTSPVTSRQHKFRWGTS